MYDVDEKKLQAAMEETLKDQELFNEALNEGWKPDYQKAIEQWHTVCLELDIGEGYVDHILAKHSEVDLIECINSMLEGQAEEFLSNDEESEESIDPKDYRLLEIETINGIVVNSYPLSELELQRGRLYKIHGGGVMDGNHQLIIATPISLGMQGPGDVPHFDVPEYDEDQIVGVQYDCCKEIKEAVNTNAERWKQLLQVLGL